MKTPHKHAAVIAAWAYGETIEYYDKSYKKWIATTGNSPLWVGDTEYRIKPEPKPDTVVHGYVERLGIRAELNNTGAHRDLTDNIKLTFDGETGKLKSAEVL